jgi:hypothetical protein
VELVTGYHSFPVTVYAEGSPLEGARVCLWKGDNLYLVENTDGSGNAQFEISPIDSGAIMVTATKNGYLPYLGSIHIIGSLSGIADGESLTRKLQVTVTPNPVTGSAIIRFGLPRYGRDDSPPTMKIYDASGRLVRTLPVAESHISGGTVTWDGQLGSGAAAPPGIYFIKLSYGRSSTTSKFVILR